MIARNDGKSRDAASAAQEGHPHAVRTVGLRPGVGVSLGGAVALIGAILIGKVHAHECNNPTSATITAPSPDFCYGDETSVSITASASDQDGLSKLEILIGGVVKKTWTFTCSGTTSTNKIWQWNASTHPESCNVSITVRATDCCDPPNSKTSTAVTGEVDRTDPSATITEPPDESDACEDTDVTATATDNCTVESLSIAWADSEQGPWTTLVMCPGSPCSSTLAGLSGLKYLKATAEDCPGNTDESDIISVTITAVDMDIDSVLDILEENPGGIVVRRYDGNNAPRKKIILRKVQPAHSVTLSRNNTKVKVFDAQTGGSEIAFNGTENKFTDGQLPKDLWVQGDAGSGSMRDVSLTLSADGTTCSDTVKFTVLWVTVSSDHVASVNEDNAARPVYGAIVVPPPAYTLRYHLFVTDLQCHNGRGSEFIGAVAPSDLVPSQFSGSMRLAREVVNGNAFWGPTGKENSQAAPPGDATSDSDYRDDDPQSGGSNGKIYDLDIPGLGALNNTPSNDMGVTRRARHRNFIYSM